MSTKLGTPIADFETQLATQIDPGDTGGTLQSYTDDDSVTLPNGKYFFTLDIGNSYKEHVVCDLTAGVMSNIKSISRQGVQTTGAARRHRIGASVTITDWAHIKYMNDLLAGTTQLNASVPLAYDGVATLTPGSNQLATVLYADALAIAGSPDATTTQKGIQKISVAPVSPTSPISVGDNDPRVPTQSENDAMVGTSGTPSSSNKFVTNDDTSATRSANKVVRYDSGAKLSSDNLITSYPLGESFTGATTPQPAVVINDIVQPLFDGLSTFGAAASPSLSSKIVPQQNVSIASIVTQLYRGTDPSTNLTIEIQTDNAGVPSNTPVTNGTSNTVASSTLKNTEFRLFNFTFATPPVLVAGTTYHVVFKTSATNANQITVPTLTNAKKYANYSGASYNGSAWSANQPIPYFEIIPSAAGSFSLWRADGDGVEPLQNYTGICTTTGSAGATGTLVRSGAIGGFTSLALNAEYYVSNTIGTLTLNKNEGQFAGIAVSATELVVPLTKVRPRNSNYYLSFIVSNEASNPWYSAIFYAYEDGFFTFNATATVKNSSAATITAGSMNTYVNATSPAASGIGVGFLGTAGTNGDHLGTINVQAKRGERFQLSQGNAGGGGNSPTITSIYFQPLN